MTLEEIKAKGGQPTPTGGMTLEQVKSGQFPKTPDEGVIQNLNRQLSEGDTLHPKLRKWYGARVVEDVKKGLSESYNVAKTSVQKNMSNGPGLDPFSTGVQVAAPLVKAAAAPLSEGFSSALTGLYHLTNYISQGDLSELVKRAGDSETGQQAVGVLQNIAKTWNDFATKHPTVAADLKSTYDIGTNLPVVAAEYNIGKGLIEKGGEMVAERAAKQAAKESDKLAELVQSPADAAGKNLASGKEITKQGVGPFSKNVVPPSDADKAAADMFKEQLVANDPAKSASNITDHINDVSENTVKPFLQSHNSIFNKKVAQSTLDAVKDESPLNFTANEGEKTYEKVIDTAMREIEKQPQNMEGLWEARKSFDDAVLEQFPHAYEGASTATKQAIRNVRQAMNDMIIEGTGGGADNTFMQSMSRLSSAFDVRDTLLEKASSTVGKSWLSQFRAAHPYVDFGIKTAIGTGIAGGGYHIATHH